MMINTNNLVSNESSQGKAIQEADDDDVMKISQSLICKNREAYEELAR